MFLYLQLAPAFWQLSQRRFMACAAIVAACGVISFIVGYIHRMRLLDVQKGWIHTVRRIFEILAHQVINPAALDKMIDAEEQAGFSTVLTDMSSPMLANEAKNAIQSLAK